METYRGTSSSHENFHQLSKGLQRIHHGMTTLKTNTLTDLFISNLLTSLRSNQLQNHTNLLTYTDKRKVFSIESNLENRTLPPQTYGLTQNYN